MSQSRSFCQFCIHSESLYYFNWFSKKGANSSFGSARCEFSRATGVSREMSNITEQLKSIFKTSQQIEIRKWVGWGQKKICQANRWKWFKKAAMEMEEDGGNENEVAEWWRWREVTRPWQWWIALILLLAFLSHFPEHRHLFIRLPSWRARAEAGRCSSTGWWRPISQRVQRHLFHCIPQLILSRQSLHTPSHTIFCVNLN